MFTDSRIHGCLHLSSASSHQHQFTDSRVHGCLGQKKNKSFFSNLVNVHGFTDSRVHGCLGQEKNKEFFFQPRFMDSRITLVHFCFLLPSHCAQVHVKKIKKYIVVLVFVSLVSAHTFTLTSLTAVLQKGQISRR